MPKLIRTEPLASCGKGLASVRQRRAMTRRERIINQCSDCQRLYVNAGYAWRCERWHRP